MAKDLVKVQSIDSFFIKAFTNKKFKLGYHWQMDSRSQEGQESAGQHRDAQGKPHFSYYLSANFVSAKAM